MADIYPLLPLRGVLVFPGLVVPLEVGREKSVSALENSMLRDRRIVFASQKELRNDHPGPGDIYQVGTLAEVKQVIKLPGGTMKTVVEGIARARILAYTDEDPYFQVEVETLDEVQETGTEIEALVRSLVHQYEQYMKVSKKMPPEALISINIDEPGRLADTIVTHLDLRTDEKQEVLEAFGIRERLEKVHMILTRQLELLELERKINIRVRKQMEKTQREYYLREQMKAIQRELGEREERGEAEDMRERVEKLHLPTDAEEKVLRDVERLEKMPAMSAEAVVVRSYLDWIVSLPWNEETEESIDLKAAEAILEAEHFGLKKVKERILEFLAIRKLVPKMKGPILCLVGPPGVGKTSLGKSIAHALNRNFVRISLGGVRDEAEIRGHRRTYVGAMPGRIIQGMRQAKSRNPVFLLDEIDKMSADFRGDPSAALLEVLDPEQNQNFSDHYIEVPYDLSKVMFITTANGVYGLPRPLLDRMEIISIPGYTEEEKLGIARGHLLPKVLTEHGLMEKDLDMSKGTLESIIREYTREAGVRNLERSMATIARKVAKELVMKEESVPAKVTATNLHRYLGSSHFRYGLAEKESEVGVATAVYWTETGGDVAPIEVTLMKGKGILLLTGKLGEVMKESAQAGMSYIRSRAAKFGIDEDFSEKYDIHVHVPEGATPKEGPSAGITMATALVSALSCRPVRREVAMTGEITLRGRVLPIGGLKEKVLAAHRAGITTMVIPKDNKADLEDIPANVRRKIHFILAEDMDQVLETSLLPPS